MSKPTHDELKITLDFKADDMFLESDLLFQFEIRELIRRNEHLHLDQVKTILEYEFALIKDLANSARLVE